MLWDFAGIWGPFGHEPCHPRWGARPPTARAVPHSREKIVPLTFAYITLPVVGMDFERARSVPGLSSRSVPENRWHDKRQAVKLGVS